MEHLSIEQLLAQREGEADASTADHLAGCDRCRREADRLDSLATAMADLPEIAPRRDFWPEIESVLDRAERSRRRRWLAAAAVVLMIIGAGAVAMRLHDRGQLENEGPQANSRQIIDELVSASRELEGLLERPALRSRVMGPRQAAMIVNLEDRISTIDAVLTAPVEPTSDDRTVALWTQRVRLLADLVQVRGAPATTNEHRYAVSSEGS